jgi:serine O-acetyltransferase
LARFLSHLNRWLTGVEIHPGARIGRRCFIDHGMGVVIGETAEIGDDCLLYQGVVLGGTSSKKGKRHPTLEEGVVVGAGAIVLGPIRLGRGSRVGAGSVVVRSVPPESTVVGIPARTVIQRGPEDDVLQHGKLPDPTAGILQELQLEVEDLRRRLQRLEEQKGETEGTTQKNNSSMPLPVRG